MNAFDIVRETAVWFLISSPLDNIPLRPVGTQFALVFIRSEYNSIPVQKEVDAHLRII